MKIYTKTGDTGETSLFDGTRVSKAAARVDAYGEVDELNASLGVVVADAASGSGAASAAAPADLADLVDTLLAIQRDLFALGAELADPRHKIAARVTKASIDDASVARLEAWIDRFETEPVPLVRFILPGGAPTAAALHLARTVCRRAERRMVALDPPVEAVLVRYVNRLSDLLFVLARVVNHRAGATETVW